MKLVFVNIMQELQRFDSTAYISQPPVPLALLDAGTPKEIETSLLDEQTDRIRFEGDAFAFSVSTQNACAVYEHADALRASGKTVIMGGIHVTVCPDEAALHADAIVTGEAEGCFSALCDDLLSGRLKERYAGTPTTPTRMVPVDYRFFGDRRYLTPASLYATRGCNQRCAFCVSSRFMGTYRTKPLDVLEREIDQLAAIYPSAFLQFTDDNLLADRAYAGDLLMLLRRTRRRFVTMVTVDQLCDRDLVEEMAASGCQGVAVGIESVDDENCRSVDKNQNRRKPLASAVRYASERGIQVCALIMVGLPYDTPGVLSTCAKRLKEMCCTFYDIRILRIYPGTSLYRKMVASGDVTPQWWLKTDPARNCNHLLPGCLSMDFRHPTFSPVELQQVALELMIELNPLDIRSVARILRVGSRSGALGFATTLLLARERSTRQARRLLFGVERARGERERASRPS